MKMYVLSLILCCLASTLLAHPIEIVDIGNTTIEDPPTTPKSPTPAPASAPTTAIRSATSAGETMSSTTASTSTITNETTMLPPEEVTMLPKLHETYMLPTDALEEEMAPGSSEEQATEPPVDPSTTKKALGPSEEKTTEAPVDQVDQKTIKEENKNSESLCLVENTKCGFTTSNPPIHHGDCCKGLDCTYKLLGAGGRCTKGNEKTTSKPIEETVISTTAEAMPLVEMECATDNECPTDKACVNENCVNPCNCGLHAECLVIEHTPVCHCPPGYSGDAQVECQTYKCEDNHLCQWLPEEECQNTRVKQDCPMKCGNCGKVEVTQYMIGPESKSTTGLADVTNVIGLPKCSELTEEELSKGLECEMEEDNKEEIEDADNESSGEEDVIDDQNDGDDDEKKRKNQDENVGDDEEADENSDNETSEEVDDMDVHNDGEEMMITTTMITMTEDDDEKERENTIVNESEEVELTAER